MADGNVLAHPAVERMELRRRMVAAVDQLLEAVDLLVRELDSDTPDADLEPSLGAPEHPEWLCGLPREYDVVFAWSKGAADDREADGDRFAAADADLEPDLGSLGGTGAGRGAQAGWCGGRDAEASLGSIGCTYAAPWTDQRRWAQGRQDELEEACEDEGVDSDSEPGDSACVPAYRSLY